MPRKKTEVRVKRTGAWAAIDSFGDLIGAMVHCKGLGPPVTIIDRRDLADLEARLKAAEAECKRLKRKCDVLARQKENWQRIVTAPKNHPRPAAG